MVLAAVRVSGHRNIVNSVSFNHTSNEENVAMKDPDSSRIHSSIHEIIAA